MLKRIALIGLRLALGTAFLSAVGSRLGLWGGGWSPFLGYVAELNWFAPAALILAIGLTATVLETTLGLALIAGFQTRRAAYGASGLLMLFALAMLASRPRSPFDYSVFTASFAALLLAEQEVR